MSVYRKGTPNVLITRDHFSPAFYTLPRQRASGKEHLGLRENLTNFWGEKMTIPVMSHYARDQAEEAVQESSKQAHVSFRHAQCMAWDQLPRPLAVSQKVPHAMRTWFPIGSCKPHYVLHSKWYLKGENCRTNPNFPGVWRKRWKFSITNTCPSTAVSPFKLRWRLKTWGPAHNPIPTVPIHLFWNPGRQAHGPWYCQPDKTPAWGPLSFKEHSDQPSVTVHLSV